MKIYYKILDANNNIESVGFCEQSNFKNKKLEFECKSLNVVEISKDELDTICNTGVLYK